VKLSNQKYISAKGFDNGCKEKVIILSLGLFGFLAYGIDINGYVQHPEKGLCMWFQRRSRTKPTWPGMIDNFVGLHLFKIRA